jgi:hypothetical protein
MSIIELLYQDKLAEKEFPKEDSLTDEMLVKVIKDALTTAGEDVILIIANDYNKDNGFAEIKPYTEDNLAFLTSNGAQLAKPQVEEPKYCTLRNCGGIKYVECTDSIYDFVSKDEIVNHLVNQIECRDVNQVVNFINNYKDRLTVNDTDSELTVDKVREMLNKGSLLRQVRKGPFLHSARVKILKKLLNKVKQSYDEQTYVKRYEIDRLIAMYEDEPKAYPYKLICKEIIKLYTAKL